MACFFICSDFTGSLREEKMSLSQSFKVHTRGFEPEPEPLRFAWRYTICPFLALQASFKEVFLYDLGPVKRARDFWRLEEKPHL